MHFLRLKAFCFLLLFHFYLARRDFSGLYQRVKRFPVRHVRGPSPAIAEVCRAIDLACIWYPSEVLCLQRAASTACLLKLCGFRAEMVLGARLMPFKAHAWVEADGKVVNDKSYVREMYSVLDRS
jgi:hypothetical protein